MKGLGHHTSCKQTATSQHNSGTTESKGSSGFFGGGGKMMRAKPHPVGGCGGMLPQEMFEIHML